MAKTKNFVNFVIQSSSPCRDDGRDHCVVHGGRMTGHHICQTDDVLREVKRHRAEQFAKYGRNKWEDGTGPRTAWLLPLASEPAEDIEKVLRQDYEDYEEEVGSVTWVHLVREEIAEAFKESDPEALRRELLQIAALAVSWIEDLDTREGGVYGRSKAQSEM